MATFRARRIVSESGGLPPGLLRPDRTRLKAASAVRAHVVEHALDAARAERALVRADPRLRRAGRQVLVAELAVGPKLEHPENRASSGELGVAFRHLHEPADYDRIVPELPAGTVTFVFTDIEDSTELLKRLGDDYRDLLTGHRRIVRDSFTARGGVEMDTQGDAFFFVFARARDALAAAVDAQRAHAAAMWPADVSVRVRIGLHTGEPAIHEEGYVGLDVVRAARICTVGRGGQVLLSETTRALIGSGLREGVTVFPLGQRHLRGIDEPERVYEVAIDGIEREEVEPPARAASATPTTDPSDEFGREISQRLEGLGARLAAGIQERVLHALEGPMDSAGTAEREATGSVDEIASRVASLGDEIDARVRAALAGKGKGSGEA